MHGRSPLLTHTCRIGRYAFVQSSNLAVQVREYVRIKRLLHIWLLKCGSSITTASLPPANTGY